MKPLSRKKVNKGRASKQFSKHTQRSKSVNVSPNPMRGGIRM